MLEQAEMRRLEQQLRSLKLAQESEVDRQRDINAKVNFTLFLPKYQNMYKHVIFYACLSNKINWVMDQCFFIFLLSRKLFIWCLWQKHS